MPGTSAVPETQPGRSRTGATPAYPLSLRLDGRLAVVVGGGSVALRRVAGLRAAGADVLVVAPQITASLIDLASRGLIRIRRGSYAHSDLDGAWLVLACTDRADVNAQVAADAERSRLWCVRADDPAESPALLPAAAASRPGRESRHGERRNGRVSDGPGRVSVVGGGPGDPGLITAAGLGLLRHADVVVTDRLVPAELLAELPDDVLVIDAAKVPGGPAMRQEDINAALVEHAKAGRAVVRLKGGDPYVFGRGREEADACLAAGVPVDVIPGVTSAISVPAAAGIPVTHRGLTQGFTVVSGHAAPSDPRSTVDWTALARSGTTLVLLMAVEHLAGIADALMTAGMAAGTPAACVVDGWTSRQQVVAAPLENLARAVNAEQVTNPAVIVIGDTAGYAAAAKDRAEVRKDGGGGRGAPAAGALAVHAGQGARPPARGRVPARRVLVLGGARSGKSAIAELFLADRGEVEYVATGVPPGAGDREWAARVGEHRRRRPPRWRTTETLDLEQVLKSGDPAPVLIDCLSLWLARVMDESGAWFSGQGEEGEAGAAGERSRGEVAARVDRLLNSWQATSRLVVAVSSEAGCGVVPATASGRLYRDALGRFNALVAADSDEVWFCTAGLPRRLR